MTEPICYDYKRTVDLLAAIKTGKINGPIVTATDHMRNALKEYLGKCESEIRQSEIVSGRWLIETKCFGKWFSQQEIIAETVETGDVIKELYDERVFDKNTYNMLRRNKADIVSAARALIMMSLGAGSLPDNREDLKLFRLIYGKLLGSMESGGMIKLLGGLMKQLSNPAYFINALKTFSDDKTDEKTKEKIKGEPFWNGRVNTIYFQGFYYITPVQARFIEACCNADIQVVFLNWYDSNLKHAFEVWDKNRHFQDILHEELNGTGRLKYYFAEIFGGPEENNKREKHAGRLGIYNYRNCLPWIDHLNQTENRQGRFYAPAAEELRKVVRSFFPKQEIKGSIMAYPVGQYLFSLYSMWDSDKEEIRLDCDTVRAGLATGWAGRRTADSGRLMAAFEKLSAYVSDCNTVPEWEYRMANIKAIQEQVLPEFRRQGSGKDRWYDIVDNPFGQVGAFNLTDEDFAALEEVIQDIVADAKIFFGGSNTIDILKHFQHIQEIVKSKSAYMSLSAAAEERRALERMLAQLKETRPFLGSTDKDTLADAMSLFISGGIKDFESEDANDFDSDKVINLSNIESEIVYQELEKKGVPVNICFCDAEHMPGKGRRYPWPLSSGLLKSIKPEKKETAGYIADYLHSRDNIGMGNRLVFFMGLQLDKVNLSWMKEFDGKQLTSSPYLTALEGLYDIQECPAGGHLIKYREAEAVGIGLHGDGSYSIGDLPENSRLSCVDINKNVCSLRNLYDYVLSRRPYYTSDFQLNFYASSLLTLLEQFGPITTCDQRAEYVFDMLPIWSKTEEKYIKAFAEMNARSNLFERDVAPMEINGEKHYVLHNYLNQIPMKRAVALMHRNKPKTGTGNSWDCMYCPHVQCCTSAYKKETDEDEN